jgi:hypothetical protein
MGMSSKIRKSISMAGILVASATAMASEEIKTSEEALQKLTGPNQPLIGEHTLCLSVTPYFISSLTPKGVVSSFVSLQIDGATPFSKAHGTCALPDPKTGLCEHGHIKITTTVPVACNVPIGL